MGTRIVVLPGLGADGRLFGPQLEAFDSATVPAWIVPRDREGLGAYALRFAESAVEPAAGEDWIAVGFSFGGMIALEMASRLPVDRRPRAVGLISGIRSRRSVTRLFRAQVAVGTALPGSLARPLIKGPASAFLSRMCGLGPSERDALRSMASDVDWDFLRWAARACCVWGFDGRCPVAVSWMHGSRDRVVPYVAHSEFNDALDLLDDGSHLLTWTRAERVNGWLERLAGGGESRGE